MAQHEASCFCGAVGFTVTGEPKAMGYCHCSSCRSWAAAPVNAFSLWSPEALRVHKGADQIGVYNKTDRSLRKFCKRCGGHLFSDHPQWSLVDIYAAMIPSLGWKPGVHVHYGETVLPMRDGLPKMKDLPADMGGSGQTIPE